MRLQITNYMTQLQPCILGWFEINGLLTWVTIRKTKQNKTRQKTGSNNARFPPSIWVHSRSPLEDDRPLKGYCDRSRERGVGPGGGRPELGHTKKSMFPVQPVAEIVASRAAIKGCFFLNMFLL